MLKSYCEFRAAIVCAFQGREYKAIARRSPLEYPNKYVSDDPRLSSDQQYSSSSWAKRCGG